MADLIEEGLGPDDTALVLVSADELPDPADARLRHTLGWRLEAGRIEADSPHGASHLFILFDGRKNPADQVEAFKAWLGEQGLEVARVLCVVHCRLLVAHPKLMPWFEACIHYSDVVLLARRDGVENKWISDFRARFERAFHPCLFELVREGRVGNPALILTPEARRLSHVFDETEWIVDEEDEDDAEGEEEVEMKPEEDYYLERRAGGRRVHELPDIAPYLPAALE